MKQDTRVQLVSWDGSREVSLWIVETDRGQRRVWRSTQAEVAVAVARAGLRLISVRPGTAGDSILQKQLDSQAGYVKLRA